MPLSYVQYIADGVTDTFNIPFPYISQTHLFVKINGVDDPDITFPTASTVKTSLIPENGVIVEIRRITPNTSRLVDFQDGSLLSEQDMDRSMDQALFVVQETTDGLDAKLPLDTATNKWDAQNKVIKNIATGTQANDAVNYAQTVGIVDQATTQANNAVNSAANAAGSATTAQNWATKVTGTVDGSEYSAKEYALGTQNNTGGSAKNWAIQTGSTVIGHGSEYSSKEYAIGGTVPIGSAKNWAVKTTDKVDGTEFSSKEYAQGTQAGTGGSAKNWATQTGAVVTGQATEYSAKEYATGTTVSIGSSKSWATKTNASVDGTEYSAKEYAQGIQAGTGGSAKDWAIKAEDSPVISGQYSARHWAQKASQSAASINMPSMVGNGQKFLRSKADETGFEYLSALDTRAAIREIGEISDHSGSTAPSGWLLCYGQAVSRTTYSWLFSVIGTTYGAGDGSTTFNLPDYRGRVAIGMDDMGGSAAGRITSASNGGGNSTTLGGTGGAETHTLSTGQMPSHNHSYTRRGELNTYGGGSGTNMNRNDSTVNTGSTGSGNAHNNTQPWISVNKIIFAGV
jgi:microcystin-dependent protein